MRNKIQIVDDNVALTTLLAKTLSKFGYETVVENDSIQALNTARFEVPSLILLDVMMPGRDGGEVLNDLRNDPSLRHIPVILLTAIAREAQGLANMGGITSPVLSKPVQLMELLSTIENELTSSFSYTEEQSMIDTGETAQPSPFAQQPAPSTPSPFAQQAPPTHQQSSAVPAAATNPGYQAAEIEPEVRNITPGGYAESPGESPFPQANPAPEHPVPAPEGAAPTSFPPPAAHQIPQAAPQHAPPQHAAAPREPFPGHAPPAPAAPSTATNLFQFPKRENHRENVNPW